MQEDPLKTSPPSKITLFLGLEWDLEKMEIRLTTERVAKLVQRLTDLEGRADVTLKELQSKGKVTGRVTAALASQICDGAAAVMICNEEGLRKLGLAPRAKIVSLGLAASDPVTMLGGPIPASQQALARVNMSIDDIDLYVFMWCICWSIGWCISSI